MKESEHFRFSVRGFSAKRMAYLLSVISAFLLPFHAVADYRGDEYLTFVSLAFTVAALFLGSRLPETDSRRFYPFTLGLIVSLVHFFSCKL